VNYSVEWSGAALNSLAEIWMSLESSARPQLNSAVADVDKLLQFSPAEQGESRDDERRVLFAPPLVITFRVLENKRTVRIVFARLIRLDKR
jgi:plasmid stabilization system protein ParE